MDEPADIDWDVARSKPGTDRDLVVANTGETWGARQRAEVGALISGKRHDVPVSH